MTSIEIKKYCYERCFFGMDDGSQSWDLVVAESFVGSLLLFVIAPNQFGTIIHQKHVGSCVLNIGRGLLISILSSEM